MKKGATHGELLVHYLVVLVMQGGGVQMPEVLSTVLCCSCTAKVYLHEHSYLPQPI
jgi:hypothetical protein